MGQQSQKNHINIIFFLIHQFLITWSWHKFHMMRVLRLSAPLITKEHLAVTSAFPSGALGSSFSSHLSGGLLGSSSPAISSPATSHTSLGSAPELWTSGSGTSLHSSIGASSFLSPSSTLGSPSTTPFQPSFGESMLMGCRFRNLIQLIYSVRKETTDLWSFKPWRLSTHRVIYSLYTSLHPYPSRAGSGSGSYGAGLNACRRQGEATTSSQLPLSYYGWPDSKP